MGLNIVSSHNFSEWATGFAPRREGVRLPPSFGHVHSNLLDPAVVDREATMKPKKNIGCKKEEIFAFNTSLANALGVQNTRIFRYTTKKPVSRIYAGAEENIDPKQQQHNIFKKKNKKVVTHIPYRILDAPGLRNDFYANLVSWSSKSGQIAVGLLDEVFLWTEQDGAVQVPISMAYNEVLCLSFNAVEVLAIAFKDSTVVFFDAAKNRILASYMHITGPVCYLAWFPKDPSQILVGDETGNVLHLRIDWSSQPALTKITKHTVIKGHTQQICAIAFSPGGNQIAVGGNDNLVTVWDVSNWQEPKLEYKMPHRAAVKALAFCPWCPTLLATGAGSQDRMIRFWHTRSGTLIRSFNVKGQVTSLVWSRHYRQLAATFGFADTDNPLLLSVYSFPQLEPLIQVPTQCSLRVLSAVLSPNMSSICVATNDETVRFYELWSVTDQVMLITEDGCRVFGSDIIEMVEGIDKPGEIIR
jgi:meiosis-specific APC/C activator protein AMA1